MSSYFPNLVEISQAARNLRGVVEQTPLMLSLYLSERYDSEVLLKREDLQLVRSYKIRGAYNKITSLSAEELSKGVVCASAGNHAQGVAYSCRKLQVHGTIYMPTTTPKQKISQVEMFGKEFVQVVLVGDTFDEAQQMAKQEAEGKGKCFIHPFDDPKTIEGQATVGAEIMQQVTGELDYLFIPIGGGGLAAGVGSYIKQISPQTKIIGVEPQGAASMLASREAGHVVTLAEIDKFVDGAAVQRVGEKTFEICNRVLDQIISIPEGKICTTILELYNKSAIVVEPAGAMAITALDYFAEEIKGKRVVSIISGSNNDITRTEEIKERSMLYEGLKHYFVVRFPQRSGALLTFVQQVLGPKDDITHFSYQKKTNREMGPALIGVELNSRDAFEPLIRRMEEHGFIYEYINDNPHLFQYLV